MRNFILTLAICMGFLAMASNPVSKKTNTTTASTEVYFETGSHELSAEMRKTLDSWLAQIPKNTDYLMRLSGHTDNIGDGQFNRSLSEKRAREVRNYLESKGYDPDLIEFSFHGKERPAKPNTNEENRSANRRVTLEVTQFYFRNLDELRKEVSRKTHNVFKVKNTDGGLFICAKGTQLLIPSQAFLDANGNPVKGDVTVEVIEAVEMGDMLANGLGTLSEEKMLVSGGMMKIDATDQNGQPVTLAQDREILANIPTDNFDNGMTVFLSEDGSDWNNTARPVQSGFGFSREYYIQRRMYFMLEPMPEFEPNDLNIPQPPKKPVEPQKPRKPQYNTFAPKDSWIGFIGRKKREQDAQDRYDRALQNYERNMELYQVRYQKYYESEIAFGKEKLKFKKDLETYWENRRQDSLDFLASEPYQYAQQKNDSIRGASKEIQRRLHAEWKELQEKKTEERINQLEDEGALDAWHLRSYAFAVTDLQWVNVDRFWDYPMNDRRTIVALDDQPSETSISLVFENLNANLPFKYRFEDGRYQSPFIPKRESAKILAYKVLDGKIWICVAPVGESEEYELDYQQVSLKEFKNTLAQFNTAENT